MTLLEFQARLNEIVGKAAVQAPPALQQAVIDIIAFINREYANLDDDSRQEADRIVEGFIEEGTKQVRAALPHMPDGPERRVAIRGLAYFDRKHYAAPDLVAVLEAPTQITQPVVPAARASFVKVLQVILDFLFDAQQVKQHGKAVFAQLGLGLWAVDELLVGFHCAQRAFTNQAFGHVRTVHEIVDRMELFNRDPKMAVFWADETDERKVWNELKPAAVRKKLGRPTHDPIYGYLSAMGPHTSFRGLQSRAGMSVADESGRGGGVFRLFFVGAPLASQVSAANLFVVQASVSLSLKIAKVFRDALDAQESERRLKEVAAEYRSLAEAFPSRAPSTPPDPG